VEEGEAPTRFLFRMAKKHGCEEWISAMKLADGSYVSTIPSICDSWVNFYDDLFRACLVDTTIQSDLLGTNWYPLFPLTSNKLVRTLHS